MLRQIRKWTLFIVACVAVTFGSRWGFDHLLNR